MVSGDVIVSDHQPSLCFPSHHNNEQDAPQAYVANLINKRKVMWGNKLDSQGEIQYLRGFCDWSIKASQVLLNNKLAYAIHSASFDYHRPNNMYHALIETWCPVKNIFLILKGEIGISIWEMCNITSLSSLREYYEEVVPSFKEFLYVEGESSLLMTCLYLFWDFALIAREKNSDRIYHVA